MIRNQYSVTIVPAAGKPRSLVSDSDPGEQITETQVTSARELSRVLMRMLRWLTRLVNLPLFSRIDFEDVTFGSDDSVRYRFDHGFGGRVRWWVVGTNAQAVLAEDTSLSSDDTLVLISYAAATATLRVEEVGG